MHNFGHDRWVPFAPRLFGHFRESILVLDTISMIVSLLVKQEFCYENLKLQHGNMIIRNVEATNSSSRKI